MRSSFVLFRIGLPWTYTPWVARGPGHGSVGGSRRTRDRRLLGTSLLEHATSHVLEGALYHPEARLNNISGCGDSGSRGMG